MRSKTTPNRQKNQSRNLGCMSLSDHMRRLAPPNVEQFVTTHWSIVLAARDSDSPAARAALEQLCRTYWYPLYAFVRRQGYSPAEAEDLNQAFFERVFEKQYFADVDQSKGRFRGFLRAALKHFLSNDRDRARAIKRGGGIPPLDLDGLTTEERYRLEPADTLTPDRLFDRGWALTVVESAVTRMRQEYADAGKREIYEHLKFQLPGASTTGESYVQIAARLDKTESAIKSEASRLRDRFRFFVRAEIQETVAGVADIDEEIRYLLEVLSLGTVG